MNENTNKKASLSDKIIITVTLIAINIILFKHLYTEKNYTLLLLIIFVQFCAHYYTGVLLKGKENTLDVFSYKMGAAGLTLLLEFLLFVAYFSNALNCTKRNWVGSSNQRFLYLSDRYDASIETMKIPSIEIHLKQDTIVINGDPNTLN